MAFPSVGGICGSRCWRGGTGHDEVKGFLSFLLLLDTSVTRVSFFSLLLLEFKGHFEGTMNNLRELVCTLLLCGATLTLASQVGVRVRNVLCPKALSTLKAFGSPRWANVRVERQRSAVVEDSAHTPLGAECWGFKVPGGRTLGSSTDLSKQFLILPRCF